MDGSLEGAADQSAPGGGKRGFEELFDCIGSAHGSHTNSSCCSGCRLAMTMETLVGLHKDMEGVIG